MADLRIEQLPTALTLALADLVPLAAYDEQVETGYKASKITAAEIAAALLTTFEQSGLTTTSKTIVGAINEIASGGSGAAHVIAGSSDPTSAQGNDLDLYVKYATSGGETSVTGLFVKLSGAWVSIATGGGASAFIIEVTQSGQSYSIDKTAAEIDAAYADGSAMFANLVYSNISYMCELSITESGTGYVRYTFQNTWNTGFYQILIITHGGTVEVSVTNASIPSINDNFVSSSYLWSSKKTKNYTDEAIVDILPTETASGSVANFTTSLALPLVECKAQIVATQSGSGDPSPSNVRPISGVSEVEIEHDSGNIFDISDLQATGITISDGVVTGTANAFMTAFPKARGIVLNKKKNEQITMSVAAYNEQTVGATGNGLTIGFSYTDGTESTLVFSNTTTQYLKKSLTSTAGKDVEKIYFTFGSYGNNVWKLRNFQIEYGSTASDFEPYAGTTHVIDLGSTYYGGELDVTSGALSLTFGKISMTSMSGISYQEERRRFLCSIADIKMSNRRTKMFCSIYKALYDGETYDDNWDNVIYQAGDFLFIHDHRFTNPADLVAAWSNSYELVYELATPVEVTLTPEEITTLVGENNIWADTGDIEVGYKVSIKDYIDSKLASLGTRSASLTKAASPEGEKIENNETEGGNDER